jgi:hypothetical protein
MLSLDPFVLQKSVYACCVLSHGLLVRKSVYVSSQFIHRFSKCKGSRITFFSYLISDPYTDSLDNLKWTCETQQTTFGYSTMKGCWVQYSLAWVVSDFFHVNGIGQLRI